jgi:hypothetical protein
VGGINARQNSWPTTVYLQLNFRQDVLDSSTNRTNPVDYVGAWLGTLIDRETVLTSANCFPDGRRLRDNNGSAIYEVSTNK